MSTEDIGNVVAGLKVQMDMMIGILKDIQKDIKLNYMPTAQIEDRFKSQGERIGMEEKARAEDIKMIRNTLEKMDQDVKDKFIAIEIRNTNNEARKKESPFKIIAALGGLVGIIGAVTGAIIWLIKVIN